MASSVLAAEAAEGLVSRITRRRIPPSPPWRTHIVIQDELVGQLRQLDPERGEKMTYPTLVALRVKHGNPVLTSALSHDVQRLRERISRNEELRIEDLSSADPDYLIS
jgi:hypothetical protein